MKKSDLVVFKTPEELANNFAVQLMSWIEIHSGETFHIAISGGKTPDLLFNVLAQNYPNSALWQKVHFWWVDERMVAPENAESNFGTAQKLLFSLISISEKNIHRIKGENDPAEECNSYAQQIRETLPENDGWPVFDLILLGMGDDGHTASIFPNQMELLNSMSICEVAVHPQSQQKRITLTAKLINKALKVCFLVTGSNKAERLSEIFSDPEKAKLLPAAHIHPESEFLMWYTDDSALKLL